MALPTQQMPTVASPPRVPLVTTIQNRSADFLKDARLVNCFAELNPVNDEYTLQKRPGVEGYIVEDDGFDGWGIYVWANVLYSIRGNISLANVYKNVIPFDPESDIGDVVVSTIAGTYMFEEMLGNGWLVFNNGVGAYYTDGTTVTAIATYRAIYAGELVPGSNYAIVSQGTSDFTTLGAANNTPGTIFTATGTGDADETGTVNLAAGSFIVGVTYKIAIAGSTDFTLVGAASSSVGVTFTATGVGAGTGSVTIPNFPEDHVKGWAYLDGTLYVMDEDANIYGTSTLAYGGVGGFDDPRLWDPLNLIVARTGHSGGVSLQKHSSYVVALKRSSTEFFYDAANPTGSPLSSVQGAHSTFGCACAESIQDLEDCLIWVSSGVQLARQVVMLRELKVQVISTPAIDRLLENITIADHTIRTWNYVHCGHRFYALSLIDANITIVYDLDQNLWYHWHTAEGDYLPYAGHAFRGTVSLLLHTTAGNIYSASADYNLPTDDGEIFPVDIYTPNFDGETKRRKTLTAMLFDADRVEATLKVQVSDDDYNHWSNWRLVDLATERPTLTQCGTFLRRAWHMRHQAATPFRIRAVDMQLDLGTL